MVATDANICFTFLNKSLAFDVFYYFDGPWRTSECRSSSVVCAKSEQWGNVINWIPLACPLIGTGRTAFFAPSITHAKMCKVQGYAKNQKGSKWQGGSTAHRTRMGPHRMLSCMRRSVVVRTHTLLYLLSVARLGEFSIKMFAPPSPGKQDAPEKLLFAGNLHMWLPECVPENHFASLLWAPLK